MKIFQLWFSIKSTPVLVELPQVSLDASFTRLQKIIKLSVSPTCRRLLQVEIRTIVSIKKKTTATPLLLSKSSPIQRPSMKLQDFWAVKTLPKPPEKAQWSWWNWLNKKSKNLNHILKNAAVSRFLKLPHFCMIIFLPHYLFSLKIPVAADHPLPAECFPSPLGRPCCEWSVSPALFLSLRSSQ